MEPDPRIEWSHAGVTLPVEPSRAATVAAGVPVVVSVGMVAVAMAGSVVAMALPDLATSTSMTLSASLALGSPVPLWLTARWTRVRELRASYTGLTVGRMHVPRARILGADHRDGRVHLLLDDGRIVRTPQVCASVGAAIQAAFARPADLLEETRSERALVAVRGSTASPSSGRSGASAGGSREARVCSSA